MKNESKQLPHSGAAEVEIFDYLGRISEHGGRGEKGSPPVVRGRVDRGALRLFAPIDRLARNRDIFESGTIYLTFPWRYFTVPKCPQKAAM